MARIDKIKQALRGLEPEDKIHLHNTMCSEGNSGHSDDEIYENDEEFFNMFFPNDVFGAVQRTFYGDYRPMDDYVMYNGDANLDSIETSRLDRWIDDDAIAEFLDENEQYLEDLELEDEEENEVSEDRYYEMLEVLPPYYFNTLNGKKVSGGFAVSEANRHTKTPLGFRATYNGFYKVGEKYFEIGDVYFVYADEMGEPNGEGSGSVEAMTLDPDAFAKGGGVRKINGREYSTGRNWTNDHRHHNKSEDYEVPQADRKRQYATGGGVRKDFFTGREYSLGRNWTNDHRHHNKSEDYEVPQADRKRQYGTGGGLKKSTYIPNGDIDSLKTNYGQTIAGKNLLDGAYAKTKVKKPKMARTQFEDETYEYGTGGTMDSSTFKKGGYTPKEPIAFENSNLYFNGYGMDINGNKVVRVSFPNSRAFSIQTNGTLPKTNNAYGTIGFDESEINSYVKSYGSPAQKKKLKIYKK